MKSSKLLATGILLLSVASIAVPTMAGDGKGRDGKHHPGAWAQHEGFAGGEFRHVGKALNLTDAQKETLKAQRESEKTARDDLHTKLFNAREALTTAVTAGANEAELAALSDTLGKLHAQQALAGAKSQKAFLAVLTEEQKQTLADLKAKRLERKEARKTQREVTQR